MALSEPRMAVTTRRQKEEPVLADSLQSPPHIILIFNCGLCRQTLVTLFSHSVFKFKTVHLPSKAVYA